MVSEGHTSKAEYELWKKNYFTKKQKRKSKIIVEK